MQVSPAREDSLALRPKPDFRGKLNLATEIDSRRPARHTGGV